MASLPTGRISAQAAERVGNFSVEIQANWTTGEDRSFAALRPEGGYFSRAGETGPLFIACGRDSAALAAAVMLPAGGATGDTVLVALQFGQEEPDTMVLEGGEELSSMWYLRDQDVVSVFQRAHEVDSLRLQMLSAAEPGGRTGYTYAMAGLDTVLSRLGCTGAPSAPGGLSGREILNSFQLFQVSAVMYPRPMNLPDFQRYIQSHYPPELRHTDVQGDVTVRFRLLKDGGVDSASVQVLSTTNEAFNAAAIGAVRLMRFRPATAYGRPTTMWIEQPIHFISPDAPAGSRSSP